MPTLQDGEMVIFVTTGKIKSGDVVAFRYNNQVLIKRVIAVAGDLIDISEDGTVYINGVERVEPYINEKSLGECDIVFPVQVPDSQYFVMGDFRRVSLDSRSDTIGMVRRDRMIGKALLRIWPLTRLGPIR